jgi:F0F1-type ATP synthase assembly protein I
MAQEGPTPDTAQNQRALLKAMLGVVGQVGCLTLLIILVATVAGLWLDNQFQTRPWFTLGLILVSVPLTFIMVLRVVLSQAQRIQDLSSRTLGKSTQEEAEGDGHQNNSSEA